MNTVCRRLSNRVLAVSDATLLTVSRRYCRGCSVKGAEGGWGVCTGLCSLPFCSLGLGIFCCVISHISW